MNSFCAMYSLRMSFCSVPPSFVYGMPCSSAAARYIAKRIGAGELMVIDVVTAPTSMPLNSVSMSSTESTATPQRPTSPMRMRRVRIEPHERRHVEGDRQPGLSLVEEEPVALVRVPRAPEAGELAHRPDLVAVHGPVDAAGVREGSRLAQVAVHVNRGRFRSIPGRQRQPAERVRRDRWCRPPPWLVGAAGGRCRPVDGLGHWSEDSLLCPLRMRSARAYGSTRLRSPSSSQLIVPSWSACSRALGRAFDHDRLDFGPQARRSGDARAPRRR